MEVYVSGTKLSCRQCGTDVIKNVTVPPSPVPRLHRNLMLPTESEVPIIRDYISNADGLLQTLDAELVLLNSLLEKATRTREQMQKSIATHNAFLAPVQRVPTEILAEIFWISCRDNGGFHCRKAPVVLTHICSSWRTIGLNTPKLWSQITLDRSIKAWGPSILKEWILRSRNAPLTVIIDLPFFWTEETFVTPMIYLMVEESERWKSLYFSVQRNTLRCFRSIKGRLPRLELLRVSPGFYQEIDYFSDMPKLRHVDFRTPTKFIGILPAPHLTHFTSTFENATLCLAALDPLQLSPNLVYLHIICSAKWNYHRNSVVSADTTTSGMVLLRQLQTLHMHFYSDGDPSNLLDFLDAPNLRCISFDYSPVCGQLSWITQPSFSSFLHRSSHSLSYMAINPSWYDYMDHKEWLDKGYLPNVTEILRATPLLKIFKLKKGHYWMTDQVMMDLAMVDSEESHQPSVVPLLEELEFSNESIDPTLFADMVGFRCNLEDTATCRRLRTVNVQLRQHPFASPEIPEAWSNRFQGYRQQGLQISVVVNGTEGVIEKVL